MVSTLTVSRGKWTRVLVSSDVHVPPSFEVEVELSDSGWEFAVSSMLVVIDVGILLLLCDCDVRRCAFEL